MMILLAFMYLFVGIAHNVAGMDQAIASDGFAISKVSDDGDDGDPSGVPSVCDHCPTCSPGVTPVPVAAVTADPVAVSIQRVATIVPMRTACHPRLDTPPPKRPI